MLNNKNPFTNMQLKQTKLVQDRISIIEKHFSNLCNNFAAYGRKEARVRDVGDNLARAMKLYSDEEVINKSLSKTLSQLSTSLSAIEDYRNAYLQRMETKVVGELSQYEAICKHAKLEMKQMQAVRDTEINKKQVLDKIKDRNPLGRQQIMQAEVELLKASTDSNRTAKDIEDQMDLFEKRKLKDIKNILKTFIEIGLIFHSRSLELLTMAHKHVLAMDEAADLNEFRSQMGTSNDSSSNPKETRGSSLASLLEQDMPKLKSEDNDKSLSGKSKSEIECKEKSSSEDENTDDNDNDESSDFTD